MVGWKRLGANIFIIIRIIRFKTPEIDTYIEKAENLFLAYLV
jgi:hypothetical protein